MSPARLGKRVIVAAVATAAIIGGGAAAAIAVSTSGSAFFQGCLTKSSGTLYNIKS